MALFDGMIAEKWKRNISSDYRVQYAANHLRRRRRVYESDEDPLIYIAQEGKIEIKLEMIKI